MICNVSTGFSALQRAENSSIGRSDSSAAVAGDAFQCSSASRKFLNSSRARASLSVRTFQCSSASRKFLNRQQALGRGETRPSFSALQRAENSSIVLRRKPQFDHLLFQCSSASRKFLNLVMFADKTAVDQVSVLFSEPKIPQSVARTPPRWACAIRVSVLFSEPKIPQSRCPETTSRNDRGFSALQRAENSSI